MLGLQHFILLGILLTFSATVMEGPGSVIGRLWWLIGCGLFLLWQPLVSAERRLSLTQIVLVLTVVASLVFWLNWAWLSASVILLGALAGGKVIVARERRLGWFYLLAFGYLCLLLFVWISPRLYDTPLDVGVVGWARWLSIGVLLLVMVFMPWQKMDEEARVFDFLISLLILLILSSVLMAVGILIAVKHLNYIDALVTALIGLGSGVLLLSWLWNPRLGFGGFDAMVSRYLLRFGFPFEEWLHRLSEHFDQEADPEIFLDKALMSFSDLPWVVGGSIERAHAAPKVFGSTGRYRAVLTMGDLRLVLFTTYDWSATLIWQANILFKWVVEFYRARQREGLLRQMQYVKAVYETGSRVTHDVKNLLQSMEGLCFALKDEDDAELVALMRRQLPVISQRLRATLDKLAAPSRDEATLVPLSEWWGDVQQRYGAQGVAFAKSVIGSTASVPQTLFDNVADNLIANALHKRLQRNTLRIAVTLEVEGNEVHLTVSDDGEPVSEAVSGVLFDAPVVSTTGLGVGLFHAAQLAGRTGFRMGLLENRVGAVSFSLRGPLSVQSGSLPISG